MTRRAVLICPGRGTYNAPELGYLKQHKPRFDTVLDGFDAQRVALSQTTITDLDGLERFDPAVFTRGDNASGLIYASAYCDGKSLNEDLEVVAVTGNSMGWYIAMALAGAISEQDGFRLVNTMGDLMQRHLIGGQLVYPVTDENWVIDHGRKQHLLELVRTIDAKMGHDLCFSIDLGGLLVLAGNESGLRVFEDAVPKIMGRFPMRLQNHAAFHSHLQAGVSAQGRAMLSDIDVKPPNVPLIDGFGRIWWSDGCDPAKMWDYTLGAQVTETYNFSKAIETAAKEFAPDVFIVSGPGNTLGGAVAQSLIGCGWKGLQNKDDFEVLQSESNFLVSMGRKEQRNLVS
jgi:[acyl-carrier-protein] S-malonyltransferase